MNTITNIEEAENFIYNYDLYKSKAENQIVQSNLAEISKTKK